MGCFWMYVYRFGHICMVFKKPAGFWANVETLEVFDIKKYNHAVAKLFGIFGIVLIALGVPLLAGQNSAWIMFSVLGVMAESVVAMAVYSLGIEKGIGKGNRYI